MNSPNLVVGEQLLYPSLNSPNLVVGEQLLYPALIAEAEGVVGASGDEDEVEILALMKSTDWVDTNEQERSDFIANTEGENTIHYIGTILRNFFSKTFLFNSVNHF